MSLADNNYCQSELISRKYVTRNSVYKKYSRCIGTLTFYWELSLQNWGSGFHLSEVGHAIAKFFSNLLWANAFVLSGFFEGALCIFFTDPRMQFNAWLLHWTLSRSRINLDSSGIRWNGAEVWWFRKVCGGLGRSSSLDGVSEVNEWPIQ